MTCMGTHACASTRLNEFFDTHVLECYVGSCLVLHSPLDASTTQAAGARSIPGVASRARVVFPCVAQLPHGCHTVATRLPHGKTCIIRECAPRGRVWLILIKNASAGQGFQIPFIFHVATVWQPCGNRVATAPHKETRHAYVRPPGERT